MAKWIIFKEQATTTKTKVVGVWTKDEKTFLGSIRWYSPFRKYSFWPKHSTVYEKTCLLDIVAEIDRLMEERKCDKLKLK